MGAPKFAEGPAFATLAELARRSCTADATEALHIVLRALPVGYAVHDRGRALGLVRALLQLGADAAAPALHGGQHVSVLSLVSDVAIGEELAAVGAHHCARSLLQLIAVPLKQPPEYLSLLRDIPSYPQLHGASLFDTHQMEQVISGAMNCDRPYDCNRLDALEFLQMEVIRGGGTLGCMRRMMGEAAIWKKQGTFTLMLSRVCAALHRRTILSEKGDVNPLAHFTRLLLDSEEERIFKNLLAEADGAEADSAHQPHARAYWRSPHLWWNNCRRPPSLRQIAAGDRDFLRLILDAGAVLPRGVTDLHLAASMLVGALTDEAQRCGDATQPTRALLHKLAAACVNNSSDPRARVPFGERWQAAGAAVQAALDAHAATIDAREAQAARAAAQADATCVANWAAMRAVMIDLEAAMMAEDDMAATAAAAVLQQHREKLHEARELRATASNSAALRARLDAAVAAAMQKTPMSALAADDADDYAASPVAELPSSLTLRGACGELVSVPRAAAIRESEYLAAVSARWAVGGDQSVAVAELTAEQLRCFAAFVAG